jgi:hypothetical protein
VLKIFCCIFVGWGWGGIRHLSVNALTPTLAKARAHFLLRVEFIEATPFSIIIQNALTGADARRVSGVFVGVCLLAITA